jgi:glycine/D-amino acid oxidase-like deaminating enzyme
MHATDLDSIVIGGGFYGCSLASYLATAEGEDVAVLEASDELLQRASYVNQARVHHGYHYPRSLLTGLRSSLNFSRFIADHPGCIVDSFDNYYAIARRGSKVTAAQFARFCERIGAPLEPAPPEVARLFDPQRIERVFRVTEYALDARRLREQQRDTLSRAGVSVSLGSPVRRLRAVSGGVEVSFGSAEGERTVRAARVFSCVYSRTNRLLAESGIAPIPLKHEVTEIALLEVPPPFDRMGVTVMCGPFFSCMPFPPLGAHSLTHVRYTPHAEWLDRADAPPPDPYALLDRFERRSRYAHMLRDAIRYLPVLAESRYAGSLWEIKTVLPRSEVDDSRPILFRRDYGIPRLSCLIGAKLDCIYDVIDEVRAEPARQTA